MYVFDRSDCLQLALVATDNLRDPKYLPLDQADLPFRVVAPAYLRQLHAVANGVPIGLTVMTRRPFRADEWASSRTGAGVEFDASAGS